MKIKEYIKKRRALIDKELDRLVPNAEEYPRIIHKAMRYALKGGKRIRPMLCLASCQAAGGRVKAALKTACAIEIIHTYSLVHDDMPSMDNDDYRRGRLSCHKKFGAANAILTGDALLTLAFNILSCATTRPGLNCRIIEEVSRACGSLGMVGGQAADIFAEEKSLLTQEHINIRKTGALIAASCKTAAIAARAGEKKINALFRFGEYIGLAFQIVDDIFDGEGMAKLSGPKRAYQSAVELTDKAKGCISYLGPKAWDLYGLADFILSRKY